jgi:hypothetical protein
MPREGFLKGCADLLLVGHIESQGKGLPSGSGDLAGHGLCPRGIDVRHHH